jgi:hypothetical protein
MRIAALIFTTIAPFFVCGGTCCGRPKHESFVVRRELTEVQLAKLLERSGGYPRAELTCEGLCRMVHEDQRGWQMAEMAACDHTLAPPSSDEAAIAAKVTCTGVAQEYFCKGRRPLGFVEDGIGSYLGRCARLEAASVAAFRELAAQLVRFAAPAELVRRCAAAAIEEEGHAALLAGLAGEDVEGVAWRDDGASLLAVATHNAVEGCVHEAWAAVEAAWQARAATDPRLRAAMARIAAEEAEHAQLAWDLHAWLIGQLEEDERTAVIAGQRAALERLPRSVATDGPAELGMPEAGVLRAMATRFAAGLAAA